MKFHLKNVSRRKFLAGSAAASTVATFNGMLPSLAYADRTSIPPIKCDVLVCGATPSGISAAVSAARLGHDVILIEYEDHIGGIVSNGLTNADLRKHKAVGGFFNRFIQRVMDHYRESDAGDPKVPNLTACKGGWFFEPHLAEAIFNQFVTEQAPRLRVLLKYELKQAIMDNRRLTGAVFEQRDIAGHHGQINAEVLIDATYEGDLAALANAKFRLGREGREEFNEPHAGRIYMYFGSSDPLPGSTGEGDNAIQAFCFRFSATADPSNRVPVQKPEGYNRADYHYLLEDIRGGKISNLGQVFGVYPLPNGKVEFNNQHTKTGIPSESLDLAEECWSWPEATLAQRRQIFKRYLTHNVGMLWMLQNDPEITAALQKEAQRYGWCKDEFVNNNHLPRQIYVREGRRIEGEYLLTEHDGQLAPGLDRTQVQPTSVGLVEWPYDSHACHRYDPAHPGVREGYTFVTHPPFQIPYGVLVPKSVDGLLVPVGCSASRVAYNALRGEPIFMALGDACGHAAHIAVKEKVALRNVPVDRLQRSLVEDGGVITYLEDLESSNEAFAALQWLGARGMNTGYSAEPQKLLTRGEGAERLRRVLQNMTSMRDFRSEGELSNPLQLEEVTTWLQSVGFTVQQRQTQSSPNGVSVAEFAMFVYAAVAPTVS
jgi:hypothetical protein